MANGIVEYKPADLQLIKRTVAKDCSDDEFRLFIHLCKATGLDPRRKQVYAFVYGKDNKDQSKRQLTLVTSITGYRTIAESTGNYRPDTQAPRYFYCEKTATNPLGIERCEVTVFKHSHGEWFPVVGEAWWDEFVPLKEEWDDVARKKTGKVSIDPKKTGWTKMPRLMVAKCAEVAALRKAWPDSFANLYEEAETDRESARLDVIDAIGKAEEDDRLAKIGVGHHRTIMADFGTGIIDRVPVGEFADRALAFIEKTSDPEAILDWETRNRNGLLEFWAIDKSARIAIKRAVEQAVDKANEGRAA